MSRPFSEWPEVLDAPAVMDCTGMARDDVHRMFRAKGFPTINSEKARYRRVGKYALRAWINKGAIQDDD